MPSGPKVKARTSGRAGRGAIAKRANAVHVMQKLLYCWAHGHEGVLLYSSREPGWPRQHDTEYGFVDHFYCPRFIYGAASAFMDRYAGFRFEGILREDGNLHIYAFSQGRQRLIAAFAAVSPVPIELKSDAGAATLIDAMGNGSPLPDPRRATIRAGDYPQSVLLDEATSVELCPPTEPG